MKRTSKRITTLSIPSANLIKRSAYISFLLGEPPNFKIQLSLVCTNDLILGRPQAALSLKDKAGRLRAQSLNLKLAE